MALLSATHKHTAHRSRSARCADLPLQNSNPLLSSFRRLEALTAATPHAALRDTSGGITT